ncbi:MAG TPA: glycosyltransferase [Chloroflexia bacterium]|nr:glycosyltransferase [Chloroflexia bacterium]
MRIAMLVGSFPVVSETFILRQITGLLDLGHGVDIYAEAKPEESAPEHAEVRRYRLLARTMYMNMPPDAGYWEMPVWPLTGQTWLPGASQPIPNMARALRAAPALARCLRRSPRLALEVLRPSQYSYQARSLSNLYRLDTLCSRRRRYSIAHAHFGPVANRLRFAGELWGVPLVASFHGYDFSRVPRQQGPDVYTRLFVRADMVTVNSRHTEKRLQELGCPPSKLRRLHMGIDLHQFPFHERVPHAGEPVRILTVGRLVEKKGIEYAIRAVAQARERYPDLVYDIVGEGPLRASLEALIGELGVGEAVTLHGAKSGEYVRDMMAQAHLFVMPSVTARDGDSEGQGLALQEAQASGLPVLATDHNGFSESIAPGRSGFLVPERDATELAARLVYLLERPELWSEMGRAGRRHVEENYDISVLNQRLVELYKEAREIYRGKGRHR